MKNLNKMILSVMLSSTEFSAKTRAAIHNHLGGNDLADAYMKAVVGEFKARKAYTADPSNKSKQKKFFCAKKERRTLYKQIVRSNISRGTTIPHDKDKDGNKLNTTKALEIKGNGRTVEFDECTNALVELGNDTILCRFHWEAAGYKKPPRFIPVNGSIYRYLYGSNGGWKKGVAVYGPSEFYEDNKELFEEELPYTESLTDAGKNAGYTTVDDVIKAEDALRLELNEAIKRRNGIQTALDDFNATYKSVDERKEHIDDLNILRKEMTKENDHIEFLKAEMAKLESYVTVERNPKCSKKQTTQKQQQRLQCMAGCHVDASKAIVDGELYGYSIELTDENTLFINEDIGHYFSKVEGGVFRVNTTKWQIEKDEGFNNNGDDGGMLAPYGYGEAQFRADHMVAFKGYMSEKRPIGEDENGNLLYRYDGKIVTDLWGRKKKYDASKMFVINTSVWKNWFNFESPEVVFATGPIKLRFCECHAEYGRIQMCRQLAGAWLLRATMADLRELLAEDIGDLQMFMHPMKVRDAVFGEAPMLRSEALSPWWESRLWRNTVLKKVANAVWHLIAGKIHADGAMLPVTPDTAWVEDVYIGGKDPSDPNAGVIPAGEVILPELCHEEYGVEEGDDTLLGRTPQINLEPVIRKVFGFAKMNHIEVSMRPGDYASIALSFDFDGDHLYGFWSKKLIEIAKKQYEFCKECGLKPAVFDDLTSKEWIKTVTPEAFAAHAATCGDVGKGTTPIFMIASLIGPKSKPEDEIELNGIAVTVKELMLYGILVNAAVTCLADEIKKGSKTTFLKSANGKKMKALFKGLRPFSEWFDHPYERSQFDRSADGEGMTLNLDNSFSMKICKIVGEALCGDKLAFMPSILCEQYGIAAPVEEYADFLNGHGEGRGWVYDTAHDYQGLPHARWMPLTGIEQIDNDAFNGDLFKLSKDDVDVKAILLGDDIEQQTETTPADRIRFTLNLSENEGFELPFSLALGRLQRVMINLQKEDDDGGRVIREIRYDAYARGKEAVKLIAKKRYDIDLDDKQAHIVLCQQEGNYLTAKWASELSGSEIVYFVEYFEKELKEAADRWLKSGKDDKGEKVNIWTDEDLLFYDVPDCTMD